MGRFEYEFFQPGSVLNSEQPEKEPVIKYKEVECTVPSRFGSFLIWPSKFGNPSRMGLYDVGVIDFSVAAFTTAKVSLVEGGGVKVDQNSDRPLVAEHAAKIIRNGIGMEQFGLRVEAHNDFREKHVGLASAAAVQHAVAYATNELFGSPFSSEQLIKYLPQNYGEETSKPGLLAMEPSTGGVGAVSLFGGGVVALGEGLRVLGKVSIPEDLVYVLGVPYINRQDYIGEMEAVFQKVFVYYQKLDAEWSGVKEKVVSEIVIPAMNRGDFKTVGEVVFDYTLNRYGDIQTSIDMLCPGVGMIEMMNSLASLRFNQEVVTAFVSSVGPNLVILTSNPKIADDHFRDLGIDAIYHFKPDNKGATFKYKLL